jgi:serine/threonine-protein kinase RsbT
MKYRVEHISDSIYLQTVSKRLAAQMGFSRRDQVHIAISVSELATNIVKYGGGGEIIFTLLDSSTIQVIARDNGPGIMNTEMAFRDHYSDSKYLLDDDFREHEGRGTGLPAVKRLMDECRIESTGNDGTVIVATKKNNSK